MFYDDDDKQRHLKDMQKRVDSQFFIDRKGRIHKFKGDMLEDVVSIHAEIARALFPADDYAEDHLMKLGWILVGSSAYHSPIIHKKATQKQLDTLFDYGQLKWLKILDSKHYVPYKDHFD